LRFKWSPHNMFVATEGTPKKRKRKLRMTKRMRELCLNYTIEAVKELESGKQWVWLPYGKILADLEGKTPYLWDALIFLQSFGWEKAEVGSDKFLVLRMKNLDYTKEMLKRLSKAIQRKVQAR